jgi:hypothetical protein
LENAKIEEKKMSLFKNNSRSGNGNGIGSFGKVQSPAFSQSV